jgi:predicted nucleotidyltransferase
LLKTTDGYIECDRPSFLGIINSGDAVTLLYVPPVTERKRIPQRTIDAVVRQIAEKFHPQKIILFGSYAYGTPRPESDVDLLIVMKKDENERKSLEIRRALNVNFGLDLLVHSPERLHQRIEMGDSFLKEIVQQGKVVYESPDA